MNDQTGESRKVPAFVIVSAVVLVLLALGYWGHQAAVSQTVEGLYEGVLGRPPVNLESYPTEAARFERSEKLIARWRAMDKPTIDFEEVSADLSLPLRITRTFRAANPENLRKQAAEVYARDLAALSGRKADAATPAAWAIEIEAWRSTMQQAKP